MVARLNGFTWSMMIGLAACFALTPARADLLDKIKADGVLLVGVTDSSPPFSSRSPGESQSIGYDVDLAGRVAAKLGVRVQQVTLRNQDRKCGNECANYSIHSF